MPMMGSLSTSSTQINTTGQIFSNEKQQQEEELKTPYYEKIVFYDNNEAVDFE